jgi:inorganic pyrophosphatase
MWHHVALHVKDAASSAVPPDAASLLSSVDNLPCDAIDLEVAAGKLERLATQGCNENVPIFRYVNEIPKGSLQKFEMQTRDPQNCIRETEKDSQKLRDFGRPSPFNYGCFPQTFRDPKFCDELSGVCGDDDQLDVIELCQGTIDVGNVVRCRPIGAVCLIDEGRADWKILVVDMDSQEPLSSARSVEDVERMAPGRLQEVLTWMDDLKKMGDGNASLDFKIHDVNTAVDIIERDHVSWRSLVADAGPNGKSRGHWIHEPVEKNGMQPLLSGVEETVEPSLWHSVGLHVRSWLDEDTGLFRCVKMPQGLCLPQTCRELGGIDQLADGALEVIDLCKEAANSGAISQCRAVGAVCLTGKGQPEWKILVVNPDSDGPLSAARSVEDVDRIAPGHIRDVCNETHLECNIQDAGKAFEMIENGHACWRRLNRQLEATVDNAQLPSFGTEDLGGHSLEDSMISTNADLDVPRYKAPRNQGASLWHHIDLHAKSCLDEEVGLFRYVNEMPQGCLQKFEMQTRDSHNTIRETEKDSMKLNAFGRPVPFNYGCFPQTFRDPKFCDGLSGVCGDDDQLDVVDLCKATVGVGQVANCRPVGAVCLIDEGRADWKILVVNTDSKEPLASARSVEDVEKLAPGRLNECLTWMDDLKQAGDNGATKLDFKVHDARLAVSIIEQDYLSYRGLVTEAGTDGKARGHWIKESEVDRTRDSKMTALLWPPLPTQQGKVEEAFQAPGDVPVYEAPKAEVTSLWHHVGLRVKTWLDEDTGLFRYVNEMPQGSLQKFEMQTRDTLNAIRETEKDSNKLKAFGQPVPFNYGCFPQTYRDPNECDELSGVCGDDDQLDVVDLCKATVGVGHVAHCRPVGAVCLIDEGRADWKILVVNTESNEPLAAAHSVEDVERVAPGRIQEALKWMDELKQWGDGDAKLDFKVHDAQTAIDIIDRDHASWRNLTAEAGSDGMARGHWIHEPVGKELDDTKIMTLQWPPVCAVPGQSKNEKTMFIGAARSMLEYHRSRAARRLTMRRELLGPK